MVKFVEDVNSGESTILKTNHRRIIDKSFGCYQSATIEAHDPINPPLRNEGSRFPLGWLRSVVYRFGAKAGEDEQAA